MIPASLFKRIRTGRVRLVCLCIVGCALRLIAAGQTPSNPHPQQDVDRLKFALVLTRHGVRSPTWTNQRLDEYSKQPWPAWPVAPGILTAHGKQLMTYFGAYYRLYFAQRALLSPKGCADAPHVYLWADSDERTRETARGLAEGMFPGCEQPVHALPGSTRDDLFHPEPDESLAQEEYAALAGRINNDPAALLPAYRMPLLAMQQVLFDCSASPCDLSGKKNLLSNEPALTRGRNNHSVQLEGPLSTSATFAENLQLEYLEGMPPDQVGWGRVDQQQLESLMVLHAASSDLTRRTPTIARAQASNLLSHILQTLSQAEQRKPVLGALGSPSDKVVFLVGHDTNISNIAALLDAHWLTDGYQPDDTPPGGALVFELWHRAGLGDAIVVYYLVQSPDQMHNTIPLTMNSPPLRASIFLPGCSLSAEDYPCSWKDFSELLLTQISKPNEH